MSRIDNELSARFDRATRPVDSPSLGKLERRRRKHQRRVRVAGIGLSIVVIAATVSVFVVARSGFGADPVASPPPPQFDLTAYGTYVFSDVGLKPYPPDPRTGRTDPHLLLVTWRAAWSSDQYPGVHDCHFSVQDGQGREMGTTRAQISTNSPVSEDPNQIEVKIDGDPEQAQTAQAWCDDARDDTPIAYDISNEHVIGNFKWRPDSDPGVSSASMSDGRSSCPTTPVRTGVRRNSSDPQARAWPAWCSRCQFPKGRWSSGCGRATSPIPSLSTRHRPFVPM